MSILNFIRAGTRVIAGLVLCASVHAATEAPVKAPAASPETASAGVAGEKARAASTEVTVPGERTVTRAPDQRPRYKGRTIRCWQRGRLILEEPVVDGPKPEGSLYQLKQSGSAQGLQLLELKDGICVIGAAAQ